MSGRGSFADRGRGRSGSRAGGSARHAPAVGARAVAALAAGAAVALAASPGAAGAARLVAAPERVDAVALDAGGGGAVLAWSAPRADGRGEVRWAEVGARGGVRQRGALLPAAADLRLAAVDVAEGGAAVICASAVGPDDARAWAVVRARGGAPFRVAALPVQPDAAGLACGVSGDGRAVAAWTAGGRLRAAGVTATGRAGGAASLARTTLAPRIAVGDDGAAAVTYLAGETDRLGGRRTAFVLRRSAGGRWGRAQRLGPAAPGSFAAPAVALPGARGAAPRVAWRTPTALRAVGGGGRAWTAAHSGGVALPADAIRLAGAGRSALLGWRTVVEPRDAGGDGATEPPAAGAASASRERAGGRRGGASARRGRASTRRGGAKARRSGTKTRRGGAKTRRGGAETRRGGAETRRGGARARRSRARRAAARASRARARGAARAAEARASRAAGRRARAAERATRVRLRGRAAQAPADDLAPDAPVPLPRGTVLGARLGTAGRGGAAPRRLGATADGAALALAAAADGSGVLAWDDVDGDRQRLLVRLAGARGAWGAARAVASAPTANAGAQAGSLGYELLAVAALPGGRALVAYAQPQAGWRQRLMVAAVG